MVRHPPRILLSVLGAAVFAAACGKGAPAVLPSAADVESHYIYPAGLEASVEDGVAELRAVQPREQLERGGRLWARAGPYVLLFSEETRSLFQDYPDLSAVRVVTVTPDGEEVARAYLPRAALNGITWQRALALAGNARVNGTERPTLLEDLVRWGEEHTTYQYAPRFQKTG